MTETHEPNAAEVLAEVLRVRSQWRRPDVRRVSDPVVKVAKECSVYAQQEALRLQTAVDETGRRRDAMRQAAKDWLDSVQKLRRIRGSVRHVASWLVDNSHGENEEGLPLWAVAEVLGISVDTLYRTITKGVDDNTIQFALMMPPYTCPACGGKHE